MGDLQTLTRPFTVARLADYWETSDTFVYEEIKAGRLQAMRLGGKLIRIKPEWVKEYECRAILGGSENSPGNGQTDPAIGTGASNGLTIEERTVSRLVRATERRQKPTLVTSGTAGH